MNGLPSAQRCRSERGPGLANPMLARRWGVSDTLIYDMLGSGDLPGFRLGKLWRIRIADIEEREAAPALPQPTTCAVLAEVPTGGVAVALPDAIRAHQCARRVARKPTAV